MSELLRRSAPDADPLPLVPISRLRPRDGLTLARTLGWYLVVRLALGVGGFGAAARLLRMSAVTGTDRPLGPFPTVSPVVRRAARGAQRVMAVPGLRVTCIPRAVVLERILTAHGVACDLVIGVLTDEGFRAHAWLEIEGNVIGINETGSRTWLPIGRFRSVRSARLMRRTA